LALTKFETLSFSSLGNTELGDSMKRFNEFLFVIGFTAVVVDAPAYAYLDGATVSLFLQGLAGAVAGALLFGRTYLEKAKSFFRGSSAGSDDQKS
jgi:hypothetical protein